MARKRDQKGPGRAGGDPSRSDGAAGNADASAGSQARPVPSLNAVGRSPAVAKATGARGLGSAKAGAKTRGAGTSASRSGARGQQVIPDAVANRMARRIAIATGIPTVMGMGVFIGSYLVVSRGLLDIPPSATLVASGACFLLGLVGLSYGVLSASWEQSAGSLLGFEQIGVNIGRLRGSIRAMRQGAGGSGGTQG